MYDNNHHWLKKMMDDRITDTLRPQYQEVAPNSKKWQAVLWRKIALTAPDTHALADTHAHTCIIIFHAHLYTYIFP